MVFAKLLHPAWTHASHVTKALAKHSLGQATCQFKRTLHVTPTALNVSSKLAASLEQAINQCEVFPPGDLPDFLVEFKEKSSFKIRDIPGQTNVVISRAFGNEKIKLHFSVKDIQLAELSKNPKTQEREITSFPVECIITITKGEENGCLIFKSIVEDGEFLIQRMIFHPEREITQKSELVHFKGYRGPNIQLLDDHLKSWVYQFLEEREIDEVLALFISNYIEYKDQKEYPKWLKNWLTFLRK